MATEAADACPVCLYPIASEEEQRIHCGHNLHESCVVELRRRGVSNTCPLCRASCRELRTVQCILAELYTLCVRASRASGYTEGLSYTGNPNFSVDVEALGLQVLSLAREAHALDPDNWKIKLELGQALRRANFFQAAKQHFQTMITEGVPTEHLAELHCQLGFTLSELGEEDSSVSHLRKAVEADPEWWLPRSELGYLLIKRNEGTRFNQGNMMELLEAEHHLIEGIRLNPEDDDDSIQDLRRVRALLNVRVQGLTCLDRCLNGRVGLVRQHFNASGHVGVCIDGHVWHMNLMNLENLTSAREIHSSCPSELNSANEHIIAPAEDLDEAFIVDSAENVRSLTNGPSEEDTLSQLCD